MKLGVYGGTFNPIHNGHLHVLTGVQERLRLDRLLLIPTSQPPHKRAKSLASEEDRLAMCRLAVTDMDWITVDDREIRRGGLSYTSDTLRELHRDYPGSEIYFITGSDMFLTVDNWHESEQIARMCTVVGFLRNPDTMEMLERKAETLTAQGWKVLLMDLPPMDASSTEIRAGQFELLPDPVAEYVRQHHLYPQEENV